MISPPAELHDPLRKAGFRLRIRRAAGWSHRLLGMLVAVACVCVVLGAISPPALSIFFRIFTVLLASIAALGLLLPLVWPTPTRKSAAALDSECGLPDSSVALLELPTDGKWGQALLSDNLRRIRSASFPSLKNEMRAVALTALVCVVLILSSAIWFPAVPEPVAAGPSPESLVPFEDVLKDWTAMVDSGTAPPEIQQATKELKAALEDRQNKPGVSLLKIGKLEDRISQQVSAVEELNALLPALAEALGATTPGVADALAKGDLSKAAESLSAAARSAVPLTPGAAEAMANLARQLSAAGMEQLAGAVRSAADSKSDQESQFAMQNLSEALSDAESKRQAQKMMDLAKMQMAAARQGMSGSKEGSLSELPKLSESGNRGQGAGAGTNPGGVPLGDARTEPSLLAPLSGQADAGGETHVEVLPSNEGSSESASVSAKPVTPIAGQLSEEAIETEALPVAHRATIRRYFETIRSKQKTP